MFHDAFQSGNSGVEIFSPTGKTPSKGWKISPSVSKVYDRTVKGFVFLIDKSNNATMQIPSTNKETLGLTQRYLVFQIRCFANKPITIEIATLNKHDHRTRLHFSSKFREVDCNSLHAQLPLTISYPDRWVNFVIDLVETNKECLGVSDYSSIDSICLHSSCRVRKIFTLPTIDIVNFECPSAFEYPIGTEYYTQIYDTVSHIGGEIGSVLLPNTPTITNKHNKEDENIYNNITINNSDINDNNEDDNILVNGGDDSIFNNDDIHAFISDIDTVINENRKYLDSQNNNNNIDIHIYNDNSGIDDVSYRYGDAKTEPSLDINHRIEQNEADIRLLHYDINADSNIRSLLKMSESPQYNNIKKSTEGFGISMSANKRMNDLVSSNRHNDNTNDANSNSNVQSHIDRNDINSSNDNPWESSRHVVSRVSGRNVISKSTTSRSNSHSNIIHNAVVHNNISARQTYNKDVLLSFVENINENMSDDKKNVLKKSLNLLLQTLQKEYYEEFDS